MNRRYLSALTSVLYLLGFAALVSMVANALDIITFVHSEKIFAGILVVLCGYFAATFKVTGIENEKIRKKIIRRQLFFVFIFYIIMLVDFTLIDGSMGRNIFNVLSWDETAFMEYINTSTNLVPFKTVRLFINGYKNGYLPVFAMIENILGNLLAFMPLPFFVSCLFKHFEKWYTILITVTCSVFLVELLQFLFLTGSSDIDDVILNVSGAMLLYAIMKIKKISKIISKLTFGVWETENNKRQKNGNLENKSKRKN